MSRKKKRLFGEIIESGREERRKERAEICPCLNLISLEEGTECWEKSSNPNVRKGE